MNQSFKTGFEKVAKEQKETNPLQAAGLAAGGTTIAAGGAEFAKERFKDISEKMQKGKNVHTTDKFLKKLKPGDIILTGAQKGSALDEGIRLDRYSERVMNSKNKIVKAIGKKKLPVNEHDLLKLVSGSPYYHMAIYKGKGVVVNSNGSKVVGERLKGLIQGGKAKAYRFNDLKPNEINKAIQKADSLRGRGYKSIGEQVTMGAKMLLDPTKGGKVCRKDAGGNIVCTEVVSKAYPKKFKNIISAPDVRSAKGIEYVAGYGKAKTPLRHTVISKGISPFARAAKYALPAGAVAGAGTAIYNMLKKKGE